MTCASQFSDAVRPCRAEIRQRVVWQLNVPFTFLVRSASNVLYHERQTTTATEDPWSEACNRASSKNPSVATNKRLNSEHQT